MIKVKQMAKKKESLKKPIAPLMKNMEIGGVELYPAVQRVSIEGTRQRLQSQYPNLKFSIVKMDETTIIVTRIN